MKTLQKIILAFVVLALIVMGKMIHEQGEEIKQLNDTLDRKREVISEMSKDLIDVVEVLDSHGYGKIVTPTQEDLIKRREGVSIEEEVYDRLSKSESSCFILGNYMLKKLGS